MMRAKLIEFTAVSFVRAAKSVSAKSALTMVCASSNEPSSAMLWTLESSTVVIWRRCTRRGTRVARGGNDHSRAAILFREQAGEEPAQELHRHVLEGERRPMKQLEQEKIRRERHQRRDRVVRKIGIGSLNIGLEFVPRESVADKRPHHAQRHLGIREAGEFADRLLAEYGPILRQIETAVRSRAAKQDFGKL